MNLLEKYKTMSLVQKEPPLLRVVDNGVPTESSEHISKSIYHLVEVGEPEAAEATIWENPFPRGSSASRQETLCQCMDATRQTSYDRVAAAWHGGSISQEICNAGREVDRVYAHVLAGKAKLSDLRQAVESWEKVCIKACEEHQI